MESGEPSPLAIPIRTGYTFNGWFTEENGGSQILDSTIVRTVNNHTLYAQWSANDYYVSYNPNEGECDSLGKWVTFDSEYGELAIPRRTGYAFDGWFISLAGDKITAETTVKTASDHTLIAKWNANQYTVTFNANGGSVSPANKKVTYDGTYGELPTPTRAGYTFKGWFTASTGGTQITAETQVTTASDHEIYAQWVKNPIVTFNANGGSVSQTTKEVITGETYGELPTPTRDGHTFDGWFTASTGGSQVTSTTEVTTESDHTLYAHWTPHTYTVTYDANGGSGAPSAQTKTYGVDLTLSSKKPTRSGYTFKGWATSSSGSASYQPGGTFSTNANTTLYAVWQQVINVTSVSLDQSGNQWIANNGSTVSITATVAPSNATNKTVSWSSSNTGVATVSGGTVTAREAGHTQITATAGEKSASVNVYVYNVEYTSSGTSIYVWDNTSSSDGDDATAYMSTGDKAVLETVSGSWRKIKYSNDSNIQGKYILIDSKKTRFTSYGFTWE